MVCAEVPTHKCPPVEICTKSCMRLSSPLCRIDFPVDIENL